MKGHLGVLRNVWRKETPRSTGSLLAGRQGKTDFQLVRATLVKTLNYFHTRHLTAAPTPPLPPGLPLPGGLGLALGSPSGLVDYFPDPAWPAFILMGQCLCCPGG